MSPPRACIFTLEPVALGGVNTMARAVYQMVEDWGWQPTIVYATNAGPDVSLGERLRFTLQTWRAAPRPYPHGPDPFVGLRTRVVAAPPVPLWLYYLVPQFVAGRALADFDVFIVVTGSAHCAVPLGLRGKSYVLWAATDYEDELVSRADAGDAWAKAILNTWSWPLMVAQERYALRKAGAILALSQHTAARIGERFPEVAAQIETVLYPIDTARFKPGDGAARSGLPFGRFLLLTARINDPRKNVALLLDAFAKVRARQPELALVAVGDEPSEALLEQRRSLGLQDSVHFIASLPREELVAYYQSAELFVLSSRQEGLGISILEAIACGLPVVSTDCGGPSSVVVEGQTGLLVANDDPDALAEGILRLLENPGTLDGLRASCVTFASQHFSKDVVGRQFKRAFQTVYGDRV
jgi:glycosyltransferase involved in cell wall biosynthesis